MQLNRIVINNVVIRPTYQTGAEYLCELQKVQGRIYRAKSVYIQSSVTNIGTISDKDPIRLVSKSMKELGFSDRKPITTKEVFQVAGTQNLYPCPAWIGPEICLNPLFDEEEGELLIGMKPFPIGKTYWVVFYARLRKHEKSLGIEEVNSGFPCDPLNDIWVFASRD